MTTLTSEYVACERCRQMTPPTDLHPCGPGGRWRYCSRCINEAEARPTDTVIRSSKENHGPLPCPFCGDSQLGTMQMTSFDETPPRKWMRVKCETCGAMAPDTAWNQRCSGETPEQRVCRWQPIEEGSETWEPGCCHEWWILERGNELYDFCFHCGGRIEVAATEDVSNELKASERREYHANGTYWSGVPTVNMPCDFCGLGIMEHDPRTHACRSENGPE